ncbi:GNAT family N-acetyltransferase [Parafilimonas terrae]|uniref:Ribosomal protein S18 acetylase RimI n=1 Tax=Parafilimonas terrae TaxID=1465490 RepID=A0A1I5WI30_9BACT|nr:GNAT family N-acetyltransferase [Parafilimonas terrae]SFQ19325.1 Ribosomal protein S18 acetylase RimI [Parafilimonas terrae]
MNLDITIRRATETDIPTIHKMAHAIWPPTFGDILSADQINYMLNLIYSEASLLSQLKEGHIFLLAEEGDIPIAYADYSLLKNGIYKLNKIYILPSHQGKGVGRLLIEHIIQSIKKENATSLLLNVNRYNKAKGMYERLGFKVIGEEDIDIGKGYFMNDYIMEKSLR